MDKETGVAEVRARVSASARCVEVGIEASYDCSKVFAYAIFPRVIILLKQ